MTATFHFCYELKGRASKIFQPWILLISEVVYTTCLQRENPKPKHSGTVILFNKRVLENRKLFKVFMYARLK